MMKHILFPILLSCLAIQTCRGFFHTSTIGSGKIRKSSVVDIFSLPKSAESMMTENSKGVDEKPIVSLRNFISPSISGLCTVLCMPYLANSVEGQFGVLEGRYLGMLHPVGMILLYGLSIAAAYHGYQWRRARELNFEIKNMQSLRDDASLMVVKDLQNQRSTILSGGHKDKHTIMGSILLGSGVFLSLEGGLSTYFRVGELFPGDHLFVGAAMTALWAVASGMTPWMARGKQWARNGHVVLNIIGLGLFSWQMLSGLEIMINVWNRVPGW